MCCLTNKVIKSDSKSLHIEDKLCDTLQAMARTNAETVHQISLFHIQSNLDRLGLLSPTYSQRPQQQSGQITLHSFDQQAQVSQGHTSYKNRENWNTEVHGGGGLAGEADA